MSRELRLVYVVSRICCDEYFCTEVVFVTSDENVARSYCEAHNIKDRCWDGNIRNTVTYKAYPVLVNEVIASNDN